MCRKILAKIEVEFIAESLNDFYKLHFMKKAKQRKKCFEIIKNSNVLESVNIKGFKNFTLEFDFHLTSSKRAYDIINYSATIKMIEDSLVELKLFKNDDNNNIVRHIINKPKKIKDLAFSKTIIKIYGEKIDE